MNSLPMTNGMEFNNDSQDIFGDASEDVLRCVNSSSGIVTRNSTNLSARSFRNEKEAELLAFTFSNPKSYKALYLSSLKRVCQIEAKDASDGLAVLDIPAAVSSI